MRQLATYVGVSLGAALLAAGVVGVTWAPDQVRKTPLDVDSRTTLTGTAARLDGPIRPIRVTSTTQVDSDASDDDAAVFVNVSCVVFTDEGDPPDCGEDPDTLPSTGDEEPVDPRTLTISVDRFVTDRTTGMALDQDGYLPDDAEVVQHEGLVNKFPFGTERTTYEFWDLLTGQAWPARYVEEVTVDGLETYHFEVVIDSDEAEVIPGTTGGYQNTTDLFVEPVTGSIVDREVDQTRFLDGEQILQLQGAFTDEQVTESVDAAQESRRKILAVTQVLPIVGFVGGGVVLGLVALLVVLRRRRATG